MLNRKELKKLELLIKEVTRVEISALVNQQINNYNKLLLINPLNRNSIDKAKNLLNSVEALNNVILAFQSFTNIITQDTTESTQQQFEIFLKYDKWISNIRSSLKTQEENLNRIEDEQHQQRLKSPRLTFDADISTSSNEEQVTEILNDIESGNQSLLRLSARLITKIYASTLLKKIIETTQEQFDEKTTQFYASGENKIEGFTHLKQLEPFKKYLETWIKQHSSAIETMRPCLNLENAISRSSLLIIKLPELSEFKELGKHLRATELPKVKKTIEVEEDLKSKGKTREKLKEREISVVDTSPTHVKNIAAIIKLIDEVDALIDKKRSALTKQIESSKLKVASNLKSEPEKHKSKSKEHNRQRSSSHPQLFFAQKTGIKNEVKSEIGHELPSAAPKKGLGRKVSRVTPRNHTRQRSRSTNVFSPFEPRSKITTAASQRPVSMLIQVNETKDLDDTNTSLNPM